VRFVSVLYHAAFNISINYYVTLLLIFPPNELNHPFTWSAAVDFPHPMDS